jgi:quinol monooxygenase YgiN
MPLPVLIGFAGVPVAAAATGMLAGRCARQPQAGLIVWTAATLGLTIALAAQSMGFASGFGPATFRAVQLLAILLAPLWLAWGLVETAVASDAARFGVRLISAALTVVASVILATDPLSGPPFSKAWPLTGPHFQPVALYALDAVQAVAVLAAVASVAAAAARARPGPAQEARPARPVVTVVAVGLAVLITAGQRFALPARAAYPLISMAAAALVWFGVSRVGERPAGTAGRAGSRRGPQDVQDDSDRPGDDFWPGRSPGRYARDERPAARGRRGGPPYGRILIFTLLGDRAADFDRLAEEAAEQVRTGEPGTLAYVIHLVPDAPMQRIFYEIYRDRAAFDSHESQPYTQRFVTERRSCVLATNVIELRLKYAKIAPLPVPRAAASPPAPPRRLPPPARYDERYEQRRVPSGRPYSGSYGG